jgi:hypothetical protein
MLQHTYVTVMGGHLLAVSSVSRHRLCTWSSDSFWHRHFVMSSWNQLFTWTGPSLHICRSWHPWCKASVICIRITLLPKNCNSFFSYRVRGYTSQLQKINGNIQEFYHYRFNTYDKYTLYMKVIDIKYILLVKSTLKYSTVHSGINDLQNWRMIC